MTDQWMIESLKKLGLTEYEAKTYIALNRIMVGTVLDINVISDIPRSAIYGALSKLEEKGLIEVEHGKPMRYKSVVPAKAINKLRSNINEESDRVVSYLEEAYKLGENPETVDAMWTTRGVMNLYNKFADMIASAEKSIIVITADPLFDELGRQYPVFNNVFSLIQQKISAGVRVRMVCTTKTMAEYVTGKLPDIEVRVMDPSRPSTNMPFMSGVMMTDDSEVLLSIVGDLARRDHKDITAIHTRMENILTIFRHFMEVEWDSAIPVKI